MLLYISQAIPWWLPHRHAGCALQICDVLWTYPRGFEPGFGCILQGPVRSSKRVGIEESNTVTASDDFLLESGAAVQCVRISSMTVYGQPLLPVILGMQLRYENVIRGEVKTPNLRHIPSYFNLRHIL
jgi:hypothetical protein